MPAVLRSNKIIKDYTAK